MSSPIQANPIGDLPSKIVAPTGTPDYDAARAKREKWYAKLFAEGELRSEEEKVRLEQILAEWEAEPVLTWEEISAQIDRTTSLEEIVAEMRREAEAEK
jgi:hypothetical protein